MLEGTYLVKEAILADELFAGLGVDGDGEPHMCHQQLGRERAKTSERAPWDTEHPHPSP